LFIVAPVYFRVGASENPGRFNNTLDAVLKLVRQLAERYERVEFCYNSGPTGYRLFRQIRSLGSGQMPDRRLNCHRNIREICSPFFQLRVAKKSKLNIMFLEHVQRCIFSAGVRNERVY